MYFEHPTNVILIVAHDHEFVVKTQGYFALVAIAYPNVGPPTSLGTSSFADAHAFVMEAIQAGGRGRIDEYACPLHLKTPLFIRRLRDINAPTERKTQTV
jgi:hypothetical protein